MHKVNVYSLIAALIIGFIPKHLSAQTRGDGLVLVELTTESNDGQQYSNAQQRINYNRINEYFSCGGLLIVKDDQREIPFYKLTEDNAFITQSYDTIDVSKLNEESKVIDYIDSHGFNQSLEWSKQNFINLKGLKAPEIKSRRYMIIIPSEKSLDFLNNGEISLRQISPQVFVDPDLLEAEEGNVAVNFIYGQYYSYWW